MKQYIVDAFTDTVFHGNPAAVCVMDRWPSDELMQAIAIENNFSETAFTVKEGARCLAPVCQTMSPAGQAVPKAKAASEEGETYGLRWFTPGGEIDLCGHATLAAAWVLYHFFDMEAPVITFLTRSGALHVAREGERMVMDFPAYHLNPVPVTDAMAESLGVWPVEAWLDRDLMLVLSDGDAVRALKPDPQKLRQLDGLLTIVTAPAQGEYDCISRVFAPKLNVPEDPVTGSAHCMIAPYWVHRLNRPKIRAFQASARQGEMQCTLSENRVRISGCATLFAISEIAGTMQTAFGS
ncbi:MAG: PhzF family phenazine biosynthesis protein [Clostridia bacterium]|nr:PhzF family phenazine biosynthesis protein [Clostridia bacterium]